MSKYCYAIVLKRTGNFLLEDGKLPIYWNKKIAQERVKLFPECILEKVNLKELIKFVNTFPV